VIHVIEFLKWGNVACLYTQAYFLFNILSTVSSSLSGAAANCWEDILQWKLNHWTDSRKVLLNRFLGNCISFINHTYCTFLVMVNKAIILFLLHRLFHCVFLFTFCSKTPLFSYSLVDLKIWYYIIIISSIRTVWLQWLCLVLLPVDCLSWFPLLRDPFCRWDMKS